MAISLTSLSPSKNQFDVPVVSDIELTLLSDSADLDVTTTELIINDVAVQPSAYYTLTGETEVEVKFFAKRLIKYATKRYSENGVRYGQRDIFPSVFQYGQRYVCTVKIKDENGLEFEESFAFTVEEGIFYNSNPPDAFYYQQSQAMANYTPEWAKARYDKYSNFQQLVNGPGRFLQEIEDSLFKQSSAYFVQTANLNEMATLYKVELGGNFEFQTTILDDGTSLQIPPEVTGTKDITKYDLAAEYNNDIKDFYLNKLPTRLDETKTQITDLVILSETNIDNSKITIDKKLERPGYISIDIRDASRFTQIKGENFQFVNLRIKGLSRERKEQTEDLTIIDNDVYYTSKLWREIYSVQFIGMPSDAGGTFSIDHAKPHRAFVADAFSNITFEDEDKRAFWKIEDSAYGTVLKHWVLLEVNPEDIVSSLGQKDLIADYEFVDIDGSTNLSLEDIDVDRFSNWIYGINDEYLYVFDKRDEYPAIVTQLGQDNGTAHLVIDLETDDLGREDSSKTIVFSPKQKNSEKVIAQYRLSITDPTGAVRYIRRDNSWTTDKDLGVSLPDFNNDGFFSTILSYDLDQLGDYLLKVETIYRDGTRDQDCKIARVLKKQALVKYKLERLFEDATISRMFMDFDQQLKILDSNNYLHTISFKRDNVLVDYNDSILYLSEDYDEVEA